MSINVFTVCAADYYRAINLDLAGFNDIDSNVSFVELPGDAVLLINYETIVLQRIRGTLIFNQELGSWSDEELASVRLPYYQQPLRSPIISEELPKVELDNGIYIHLHSLAVSQGKDVRELVTDAIANYLQGAHI